MELGLDSIGSLGAWVALLEKGLSTWLVWSREAGKRQGVCIGGVCGG